ncbi:MAG: metallopeptidase [Blautia sp.]|nr:metallopeptidase [Blautia sp.]
MKNAIFLEREKRVELIEIGREILTNTRHELYLHMRFLDRALSGLQYMPREDIHPAGTDGTALFFSPEELAVLFRRDRTLVTRLYMHTLMHCLFGHLFITFTAQTPDAPADHEQMPAGSEQDAPSGRLENLACDITAEYLLDELELRCLHLPKSALRQELYRDLRQAIKVPTPQSVHRFLKKQIQNEEKLSELEREFLRDDHRLWHSRPPRQQREQQQRWEDIRNKMHTEMETFSKEAAQGARSIQDQLAVSVSHRYDYRDFLRRFCVLHEEMHVDPDSFDYVFYHYGLELYGNMPLIEPQETKEIHRIEDFVIVLDTSMSCSGELIRRFLEETCSILTAQNSFSRRIHIHLIQCDEKIQSDICLTNLEELSSYMEHFTVKGLGGTDFRPPFAYVNGLLAKGEFSRLRGLIYFTDGYGTFPVKKPVYDTAFVFLKEDYRDVDVPPWAMKVILDPDQPFAKET